MEKTSQISGFYKLPPGERLKKVAEFSSLTDDEAAILANPGGVPMETLDNMIENVVGAFELPVGIAMNFKVDGKDHLIPMAIEEPSVVAAASNAAKMARIRGGFFVNATEPVMIAQIQITGVKDPFGAKMKILEKKDELLEFANEQDPILVKFGGGAKDIEVRIVDSKTGVFVVTHLLVDCRDAMGANAVNSMAEALAPKMEAITGGRVYLRILSNLAVHRLVRARAVFDKEALGGENVVDGVIEAYSFAEADPYRAATHNKGIMNGIIPVVRATGNDTRAIEAGAHSFAARNGRYTSLTTWEKDANGDLVGTIEMPMAVGLVGGATKVHPTARIAVKILDVKSATELGGIIAAVGLAQNLAAMRALATEGIQRGHMGLHARNLAASVGASANEVDEVVARLLAKGDVKEHVAKEILEGLRAEKGGQ